MTFFIAKLYISSCIKYIRVGLCWSQILTSNMSLKTSPGNYKSVLEFLLFPVMKASRNIIFTRSCKNCDVKIRFTRVVETALFPLLISGCILCCACVQTFQSWSLRRFNVSCTLGTRDLRHKGYQIAPLLCVVSQVAYQ